MSPLERNAQIEALIARKEAASESYSETEKTFIAQWEGAGGLAAKGARGPGLLHEFYTPAWLCAKMWELARYHGYQEGAILEPACGTGRFFADAPPTAPLVGFEINPTAARIAQILYPQAEIYAQYFETAFLQPPLYRSTLWPGRTWLKAFPFALVIANPPYGRYVNQFSSFFKSPKFRQIESFFIYQGLQLLQSGGLLVYLTATNILSSGSAYQKEKALFAEIAELTDAYRLPPVFRYTDISTDIIILKKK